MCSPFAGGLEPVTTPWRTPAPPARALAGGNEDGAGFGEEPAHRRSGAAPHHAAPDPEAGSVDPEAWPSTVPAVPWTVGRSVR